MTLAALLNRSGTSIGEAQIFGRIAGASAARERRDRKGG